MKLLGIDIGGSGVKGAVIDTKTGKPVTERHRIPTPIPATPESVAETVADIVKHFNWTNPLGIGFPAVIHDNVVKTAANIDKSWIGTDAVELFSKATNCEVTILNDADAAGMAELKFGAGKNAHGLTILMTIGTGIGTVFFNRGKLIPNTELGHVIMPNGELAEHYASDAARKREDLNWKSWAKRFNEYLLYIESIFWPHLFIIGGGASKKYNKFASYLTPLTPVVPARLQNHAGIIGAALAAKKALKN
jgi:polyphosphate glucokinase